LGLSESAGVVLAGGVSKRFGSDKAMALVAGEPIVRRVSRALHEAVGEVYLSVKTGERGTMLMEAARPYVSGFLVDEFQLGPVSGILTAAKQLEAETLLTVSVDVPLLKPETLKNLLNHLRDKGAEAASVVWADGNVETLIQAITRKTVVRYAEKFLGARALSCRASDLLRAATPLLLVHVSRLTTDPTEFANINTPGDLEKPSPHISSKNLVRDSLILRECSSLFVRAVEQQEHGSHYEAGVSYLTEACSYMRNGVSRLSAHAFNDSAQMFKQAGMVDWTSLVEQLAELMGKN
ncbi:MAG: molybdenum cofactor guanylyltransferase, partial [Candidatus Caldarchaeum sp.]